MTMSHDLARKLLALPNLPMSGYYEGGEPMVVEELDPEHPDYKPFDAESIMDRFQENGEHTSEFAAYWASMPKKQVIGD